MLMAAISGGIMGVGLMYALITGISDKVAEKLSDSLDEINSKLDELVEKDFRFEESDDGF